MSQDSQKNIRQILVSPSKMQILDSLANNALSKEAIKYSIKTDPDIIEEILENLKKINVIEVHPNNLYSLSTTGKDLYKEIKKIIKELVI